MPTVQSEPPLEGERVASATRFPFPVPRASKSGVVHLPRQLVMLLIRGYQLTVSRFLPPTCRFHPSCSHYTLEAVARYGVIKGGWLGTRRLLRCHPWNRGGFDPVP